ncbi:hypothetical protein LX76_04630 [Cereibacter changlensis]|uniref:Uncharacterized protein n=1 Tax=Cereibacter changlensis TaxID=402884 RepID=A0A2W7QXU4_9RHOB|nr:hypothetical protein [Cereibacter changlensis]PZX46539.1 hypothetical protein LX76_04630 [Cereibacter changlensis]
MCRASFTLGVTTAKDQAPAPDLWSLILANLKAISQCRHWTELANGRAAIANVCWPDAEQGLAAMSASFAGLRFSVHVQDGFGREHFVDALGGYTDLRPGKVIFPPVTLWHTGGVTGAGCGEPRTGLTVWSIFIETEDGAASHLALTAEDAGKIACAAVEPIWHRLHRGEPMPDDWREALNLTQDQGCIGSVTVSEHVLPLPGRTQLDGVAPVIRPAERTGIPCIPALSETEAQGENPGQSRG